MSTVTPMVVTFRLQVMGYTPQKRRTSPFVLKTTAFEIVKVHGSLLFQLWLQPSATSAGWYQSVICLIVELEFTVFYGIINLIIPGCSIKSIIYT